jgi:hypothetical protein
LRTTNDLAELAAWMNPVIRGWMQYYGKFYRTEMDGLLRRINAYLMRWARSRFVRGSQRVLRTSRPTRHVPLSGPRGRRRDSVDELRAFLPDPQLHRRLRESELQLLALVAQPPLGLRLPTIGAGQRTVHPGLARVDEPVPPVAPMPTCCLGQRQLALQHGQHDLERAEGRGFNAGVDIKEIQRDEGYTALIDANQGCAAAFPADYDCSFLL